jgi:acylphosphatase
MTEIDSHEPTGRSIGRIEATVRGRVQGVGFRYYLLRIASRHGLSGWVSNESDGTVRCVVEGPQDELDRIEEFLRSGPPGAIVEAVHAVRMPATGRFHSFEVRSAGHTGD